MTLPQIAAIVACAILFGLGAFQALLIAGAPLGRFAWGGQHEVLPRNLRIGSVVAIGLYVLFALVLLDRSGLLSLVPDPLSGVAAWVLAAYGIVGTGMNSISRSLPERYLMTPLTVILTICFVVVALA